MEFSISDFIYTECEKKKQAGIEPACISYTEITNKVLEVAKQELTNMKESGFIRLSKGLNDWLIFTEDGSTNKKI